MSSPINIAGYGGNPDPSGYKVYNIPLSALGATNKTVSQVTIQDGTGQPQTAYIDELKILPALAPTGPGQNTTYTYDSLSRLLSATYPTASYSYTYDADGNRLTSNENGTQSTYTVNNDNQTTAKSSRALTFDAQGNEITDGSKTLAYDFDNRLTSYANGTQTTAFKYDGSGNRIEKNINGVQTYQYVNDLSGDLSRVLVAKNVPASTNTYYVYGIGGLISQGSTASASRQYYLDDGLGNIRAVVDSTGTNVQSYAYDPYGNTVTGNATTDFRYKNQQTDTEDGLTYLRARNYDPSTGNFTSRDPLNGTLKNPQSQQGYNYTNDNPINGSDPSGKAFLLSGVGGLFNFVANTFGQFGSTSSSACPAGYASAPGLGSVNIGGGNISANNAMSIGAQWLGPGYREIAQGVFRSADGTRQFRIVNLSKGYVNFESIGPDGRIILENSHVTVDDILIE